MMEQMTKGELQMGMKVKLRNGDKCVVSTIRLNDTLIDVEDGSWEGLESYHDNMTNIFDSRLDIVEVTDSNGNLIFVEEVMTKAEAEAKFGIRIVD